MATSMTDSPAQTVGTSPYLYRPVPGWAKLPEGWALIDVVGVVTDSQDRVFAFTRGPHPLIVFDPDGNVERWWGAGMFTRPHGLHIAPDDTLYLIKMRLVYPDGAGSKTIELSNLRANVPVEDEEFTFELPIPPSEQVEGGFRGANPRQ